MDDVRTHLNKVVTDNTADVVELSTVQFITYMIVGIPSWILYVSVIFLLVRPSNRVTFSNSYYKLAFIVGLSVRLQ